MLLRSCYMNIPDDIWIEIFILLPLVSICKSKCISKVFASLLSTSYFIDRWMKFNNSNKSPPSIVFHSYNTKHSKYDLLISYPKSLNSQFMCDNEIGFSFRFLNPNPRIYLLDSCNGLVLCTPSYHKPEMYYVCNPLTRKCVSLPPPPTTTTGFVVNGFTCESTWSTTCYTVVRIQKFESNSKKFSIEIFVSDSGEWDIREVACPDDVVWYYYHDRESAVIIDGVLYWTEMRRKILTYDMNGNAETECRLIDNPDTEGSYGDNSSYRLGTLEGLLYYARIMTSRKTLCVWVLEDEWRLLHEDVDLSNLVAEMYNYVREFENAEEENVDSLEVQVVGFSLVDKNVILLSYQTFVWAFNVITGRQEELSVANAHSAYQLSDTPSADRYRVYYPFVLKPMATILPPPSWKLERNRKRKVR